MKSNKRIILNFMLMICLFSFSITNIKAQTAGTLSFTFSQSAATAQATKNIIAVWIEDANGGFVKTRFRYVGNNTKDHLPTWAVKSGGSASNATSASCNVVDATTGATRTSSTTPSAFGTKTISWDGKNVSGTLVADGTYKIFIESSWCNPEPANNTHNVLTSFTFTKGASVFTTNPTDANFSNISISWTPSGGSSIEKTSIEAEDILLFPNPSNGLVQLNFLKETKIEKIMVWSVNGKAIYTENSIQDVKGIKTLDLTNLSEGVYIIEIVLPNRKTITKYMIVRK